MRFIQKVLGVLSYILRYDNILIDSWFIQSMVTPAYYHYPGPHGSAGMSPLEIDAECFVSVRKVLASSGRDELVEVVDQVRSDFLVRGRIAEVFAPLRSLYRVLMSDESLNGAGSQVLTAMGAIASYEIPYSND